AEADVRKAQSDYDKVSWANNVGMMPQATALEQATNNYVRAKARYDELNKRPKPEDVTSAQAKLSSAQADFQLLMAGSSTDDIAAAQANVAAPAGRVSAGQAAYQDAQLALAQMTLVARFDGTVAALHVEKGEQVSPGVAVAQLATTGQWQLETDDLTELDVVN